MRVIDASAIIAFLKREPGSERAGELIRAGAVCSAANWSEVAQKLRANGTDWGISREALKSLGIWIEPVLEIDAERAARLWRRGRSLSLADRLCLALAERLDVDIITADREWASFSSRVELIR